jgi:hypothetical protein
MGGMSDFLSFMWPMLFPLGLWLVVGIWGAIDLWRNPQTFGPSSTVTQIQARGEGV